MTPIFIQFLIMIGVMVMRVKATEWIEESESNLRERLNRIKLLKNEWPFKAKLIDQLPKYNDIFCERTHGRKG